MDPVTAPVRRKKKLKSRKKKPSPLFTPSSPTPIPPNPLSAASLSQHLLSPNPPDGSPRPGSLSSSHRKNKKRPNSKGTNGDLSTRGTPPTRTDVHPPPLSLLPSHQKTTLLLSLSSQIERLELHNVEAKLTEHTAIVSRDDKIRALTARLSASETKNAATQSQSGRLQDRIVTLENVITRQSSQIKDTMGEMKGRGDKFLGIVARLKAKQMYVDNINEQNRTRREDVAMLNQLEECIGENEFLHSEVDSLRASLLDLSSVVKDLEVADLEKDFKIRKLEKAATNNTGVAATPAGVGSTGPSPQPSPQHKSAKPARNKSLPTVTAGSAAGGARSLISSWFAETDTQAKQGADFTIDEEEDRAIEMAEKEEEAKRRRMEEEKKAKRTAELISDTKAFSQLAKGLQEGPGKMTVALTKCEHELEYMRARVAMFEQREVKANELLRTAEETMLAMVKNVEEEAMGLMEYDFVRRNENRLIPGSRAPGEDSVSSKCAEREKIEELERQKSTLLELLNEYEDDKGYDFSPELARLTLFSPRQELDIRVQLKEILGLGGEVTDEDLLYEAQLVVQERELILLEFGGDDDGPNLNVENSEDKPSPKNKRKKAKRGESPDSVESEKAELSRSPMQTINRKFSFGTELEVMELVRAKELQTKATRPRNHSVALTKAKVVADEMENEEKKARAFHSRHELEHSVHLSGVSDAMDMFEIEKAKEVHGKNRRGQKATMQHRTAADAMEAFEKEEEEEEINKAKSRGRVGMFKRQHTVKHSAAQKALDLSNLKRKEVEDEDEDESSSEEEEESNGEEEREALLLEAERAKRETMKLEASELEALQKKQQEEEEAAVAQMYPEDVVHDGTQLILNSSKMYQDPLKNFYKFNMQCSWLGTETPEGFKMFRIKAYDAEVLREMCMDVSEETLRQSLKHAPASFTYDDMDSKFHDCVLDRLKLMPGHDSNHDGFLDAGDIIRDDMTFALVAEGRWKPLKIMVEVGPQAIEKRRLAKKEEMERARDMAHSVEEERGRVLSRGKQGYEGLGGEEKVTDLRAPAFTHDMRGALDTSGGRRMSVSHVQDISNYEIVIARNGHSDMHEGSKHDQYLDDFES